MPDGAADEAVTFINRFTVHTSPEKFERAFAEACEYIARQDGFLRYTLLRHADDEHSYVNVAHWRDVEAFRNAVTDPAFGIHAAALRAVSTSQPDLYVCRQSFPASSTGEVPAGPEEPAGELRDRP